MSLARSMICVRMVNNCCFGDLLMSEVLPVRESDMELSDLPAYAVTINLIPGNDRYV